MARKKKTEAAITLVDPITLDAQLAPERSEAEAFLAGIQKANLSTQERRDAAGLTVAAIRGRLQSLKELQKSFTKPISDAKKAIDDRFRPVVEYWEACNVALSDRLLAATMEADKAQRAALALVAENRGNVERTVLDVAHSVPSAPAGLVERVTYRVKITDRSRIPLDFFEIDEAAVLRALKAGQEVPGAELEEVKSFAKGRS